VESLASVAKKSKYIYFATDEDREGEAIAWHLAELLKPKKNQIKRITFHEITKHAIQESFKHPRDIDMNRVFAQQARRILDRLVGYELSPFLWKKVARGLSAGRVQSVAVRLIVERETEIKQFETKEYWTIDAIFNKQNISPPARGGDKEGVGAGKLDPKNLPEGFFETKLHAINGESLDKFKIGDEKHAKGLVTALNDAKYSVSRIEKKETKKNPAPPFITSTLQQDANRKLHFSAKQTMRVAQQLYEEGHITYMRTDSVSLSSKFLGDAQKYLANNFGKEYVLGKARTFKTKSKTAQEAHEAIRPTEALHDPAFLKTQIEPQQHKLYDLIWRRAVASQMPEARMDNTSMRSTYPRSMTVLMVGAYVDGRPISYSSSAFTSDASL